MDPQNMYFSKSQKDYQNYTDKFLDRVIILKDKSQDNEEFRDVVGYELNILLFNLYGSDIGVLRSLISEYEKKRTQLISFPTYGRRHLPKFKKKMSNEADNSVNSDNEFINYQTVSNQIDNYFPNEEDKIVNFCGLGNHNESDVSSAEEEPESGSGSSSGSESESENETGDGSQLSSEDELDRSDIYSPDPIKSNVESPIRPVENQKVSIGLKKLSKKNKGSVSSKRCQSLNRNNKQCGLSAIEGEEYCNIHLKNPIKMNNESSGGESGCESGSESGGESGSESGGESEGGDM